jgi:zinc D-Ala-D-Ala carboxypeptidase
MNLTPNFTLEEMIHSDLASRRGISNQPPPEVLPRLMRTAQLLEQVRLVLGAPMIVTSGYRAPEVNRAVGGSSVSAHCDGRAADFMAPQYGTPAAIARRLERSNLAFDQLIFEGTWVHISQAREGEKPRFQVLTAHFNGGPPTYTEGIA